MPEDDRFETKVLLELSAAREEIKQLQANLAEAEAARDAFEAMANSFRRTCKEVRALNADNVAEMRRQVQALIDWLDEWQLTTECGRYPEFVKNKARELFGV